MKPPTMMKVQMVLWMMLRHLDPAWWSLDGGGASRCLRGLFGGAWKVWSTFKAAFCCCCCWASSSSPSLSLLLEDSSVSSVEAAGATAAFAAVDNFGCCCCSTTTEGTGAGRFVSLGVAGAMSAAWEPVSAVDFTESCCSSLVGPGLSSAAA